MFNNLRLIDDFDSVDVLTCLMAHFVNFSESADANVRIGERFKVVFAALALLAVRHTG